MLGKSVSPLQICRAMDNPRAKDVRDNGNRHEQAEYALLLRSVVVPWGPVAGHLFTALLYRHDPYSGDYQHELQSISLWLREFSEEYGIVWGWSITCTALPYVLHIDLPQGATQTRICFTERIQLESPARFIGPEYPGKSGKCETSAESVLVFCDNVLAGYAVPEAVCNS